MRRNADDIENAIAIHICDGNGRKGRKVCGQGMLRERPTAEAEEYVQAPCPVQEHRIRYALTVQIRPRESAQARHTFERSLHGKGAIAVVPQHRWRSVHARDDEVEIAIGVEIRGPDPVQRCADGLCRKPGARRDVGECLLVPLPEDPHTSSACKDQIGPEVVVEVCSEHPVRTRSRSVRT